VLAFNKSFFHYLRIQRLRRDLQRHLDNGKMSNEELQGKKSLDRKDRKGNLRENTVVFLMPAVD